MKLWLLDADIIIDLLGMGVFDKLVERYEIHVATTVVNEVKFYKSSGVKTGIDFRNSYVASDKIIELSASLQELKNVLSKLPANKQDLIHLGEQESLAILVKHPDLLFCSCDAAAIRALPFLDLSERGISAKELLDRSGLRQPNLEARHTKEYFDNNLSIGKEERIYNI